MRRATVAARFVPLEGEVGLGRGDRRRFVVHQQVVHGFQITSYFEQAPLAYTLSALAALVYLLATWCLAKGGRWVRVGVVACTIELVGVLVVGCRVLPRSGRVPRPDGLVALRPGVRVRATCAARSRAAVVPPRGPPLAAAPASPPPRKAQTSGRPARGGTPGSAGRSGLVGRIRRVGRDAPLPPGVPLGAGDLTGHRRPRPGPVLEDDAWVGPEVGVPLGVLGRAPLLATAA